MSCDKMPCVIKQPFVNVSTHTRTCARADTPTRMHANTLTHTCPSLRSCSLRLYVYWCLM